MQNNYLIIGTAGHVDHGKSQLIRAMTGIKTDRLKEEQERGMSIELGFAYLTLPDGRKAGVVDVPGHEKFVRQMLAGASGMDLVLIVIAADEGIKPQTEEHLAILSLLGIANSIVVITKIDLVDDEWLDMIEEDIRERLCHTLFSQAPICKVSSLTGKGIDNLLETISETVQMLENKNMNKPLRMPIDRIFSVQGFGTVVTGTLKSGQADKGQEVWIEPGHIQTKIRNIQVHNEQAASAFAGQRAAINLGGLSVEEINKGFVLVEPDAFDVGQVLDVKIYHLPANKKQLLHRQRIHFHLGTAEILGRVHLLDREQMEPGEECLAQILLEQPVVAVRGDRFVLRFFSPVTTIGGGEIIGLTTIKRKRFREKTLLQLNLAAKGTVHEILTAELTQPLTTDEIAKKMGLENEVVKQTIETMIAANEIAILTEEGRRLFWSAEKAGYLKNEILLLIKHYHKKYPLRRGIGREELKGKTSISFSPKRWQSVLEWLENSGDILLSEGRVQMREKSKLPAAIEKQLQCLKELWQAAKLNPPMLNEGAIHCRISEKEIMDYASYLCTTKQWQKVGEIYFDSKAVAEAQEKLIHYLKQHRTITAAQARDLWQTSRKFALPLIEYFDAIRLTRREDNVRYLVEGIINE